MTIPVRWAPPAWLRIALVLVAVASSACTSRATSEAARGRLVDRETREPIVGAHVLQVYRDGTVMGTEPRVAHSRWTQTNNDGRFTFEAEGRAIASWSPETYGPRYDFFHPDYGLVRGPTTEESYVTLEGSRDAVEQRTMDLRTFCHAAPPSDPGSRHLRSVACPSLPPR